MNYKQGDKLICIKEYPSSLKIGISGIGFKIDEKYEIFAIFGETIWITSFCGYAYDFSQKAVMEFFQTLAEYREQQINSILNGDS